MPRGGRQTLLEPTRKVPAREVAEFEVLWLVQGATVPARCAARADRGFLDGQVEHVTPLGMRALQRLLHIQQKSREILEDSQAAIAEEHLLRERGVRRARIQIRRQ